jgi:hypothetical protein
MKFWIGFITGALVGGYVWGNASPAQRERAIERTRKTVERVKRSDVSQAVAEGASDIASAASERIVEKIDDGSEAIVETVGGSPS